MKKAVYIIIVMLTSLGLAGAQADSTAFRPLLHLGLTAAYQQNEVGFSPALPQAALPGTGWGLLMSYVSEPHLGLQLTLAAEQRGWRETSAAAAGFYERPIRYLTLSPSTLVRFGRGRLQPLLAAGPFLSVPLSSREVLPAGWPDMPHYGDDFPLRIVYGIAGSAGFRLTAGRWGIQAEGRYRRGFSSLFPLGQGFNFSEPSAIEGQLSLLWLWEKRS